MITFPLQFEQSTILNAENSKTNIDAAIEALGKISLTWAEANKILKAMGDNSLERFDSK